MNKKQINEQLKYDKLLCENLVKPLGIDNTNPRFSWIFSSESRSTNQTAYRVIVSSSKEKLKNNNTDIWDSGKVETDESTNINYSGQKLKSNKRYWWKVKCRDNQNNWTSYSKPTWFETGLLKSSDWKGSWIGTGNDNKISAPLLRNVFTLDKEVAEARLYISGLGYYELYLNGKKVGDHVLDPVWTDYGPREMNDLNYPINDKMSHRVKYVKYNVTNLLNYNKNALGVILGNGWYNQRQRLAEGKFWYGYPRMILQLQIKYEDGSVEIIKSDENWKVSASPIIYNNIYTGEIYDARREIDGWHNKNFDCSDWKQAQVMEPPGGKMVSQLCPPDRKINKLKPDKVINPEHGVYIFDLGQNISGWIKMQVKGAAGTKVQLRYAEEITENGYLDFSSAGGQGQIQQDSYILKGEGEETYEPRFTWHGFRYVEVTGYPGTPSCDDITGILVHSDVEETGEFECSQEMFNEIFNLYKWAQKTNFQGGVPSDCPHRERLGYTGDGQLTAEASIYSFDMVNFYRKWIDDIADCQGEESGHVQHTAPFAGGGGGPGAWGCAYSL